jgi:hypothetical protein
MLTDPYLLFASCFATWLRLKIVMGFIIAFSIILMSLSAWQTVPVGGDFATINTYPSGHTYSHWGSLCNDYPYNFLSPFYFTYTSSNSTAGSSTSSSYTSCPYPTPNSEFRISITVMTILLLLVLTVKTPVSLIARFIHIIFALMFFSAFVIDTAAASVGLAFCSASFPNTILQKDLNSLNITLKCNGDIYAVIAFFDLLISICFFIIHTAWGMTKDLYVEKGDSSERKALLMKDNKPSKTTSKV